jgi:hypothetical protein
MRIVRPFSADARPALTSAYSWVVAAGSTPFTPVSCLLSAPIAAYEMILAGWLTTVTCVVTAPGTLYATWDSVPE